MNERIKELAEQAGFVLWKDENWNPGDIVDWSARYDDELKKFAELIVRECSSVVAEHFDSSEPWITPKTILYHFGIKE
jgi:hypothetical protein